MKNKEISETLNDQKVLDNNDYLISPVNEDTEMLILNKPKITILPTENQEIIIEHSEIINYNTNDKNSVITSDKEETKNKIDLCLESNRRKFESEIGRDIVHERRMRKELMKNLSTTGK